MDGTNPSTSRHENESRPTLFRKFTAVGTARRVGRGRLVAANDLEHAFHRTNATSRRHRVRVGNHRLCVHTHPRTRPRDGVRWFFTTHEQGNCRSSGKVLNLQIMLDRFIGAISPLAKSWTTNAGLARADNGSPCLSYGEGVQPEGPHHKGFVRVRRCSKARRPANDEIERDVGEPDASRLNEVSAMTSE